MNTCTRPPAGWTCTRPEGHSGPCPATPDETKATELEKDVIQAAFKWYEAYVANQANDSLSTMMGKNIAEAELANATVILGAATGGN